MRMRQMICTRFALPCSRWGRGFPRRAHPAALLSQAPTAALWVEMSPVSVQPLPEERKLLSIHRLISANHLSSSTNCTQGRMRILICFPLTVASVMLPLPMRDAEEWTVLKGWFAACSTGHHVSRARLSSIGFTCAP
jgi:hypothetical protein